MKLVRQYKFDKNKRRMVEVTPEAVKALLKQHRRRRRSASATSVVRGQTTVHNKPRARWPIVSENAGCMPDQVDECNAALKELGIAAKYHPDGSVEWSSNKAKQAHLRSIGCHDRDAYY